MERDQAYKEMHGYRELDRNMQGLIPRATNLGVECALTNLGVADAVVNDLLSTAHNQFRDFVPREDFIPRDPNVALNCVRGGQVRPWIEPLLLLETLSNPKVMKTESNNG